MIQNPSLKLRYLLTFSVLFLWSSDFSSSITESSFSSQCFSSFVPSISLPQHSVSLGNQPLSWSPLPCQYQKVSLQALLQLSSHCAYSLSLPAARRYILQVSPQPKYCALFSFYGPFITSLAPWTGFAPRLKRPCAYIFYETPPQSRSIQFQMCLLQASISRALSFEKIDVPQSKPTHFPYLSAIKACWKVFERYWMESCYFRVILEFHALFEEIDTASSYLPSTFSLWESYFPLRIWIFCLLRPLVYPLHQLYAMYLLWVPCTGLKQIY